MGDIHHLVRTHGREEAKNLDPSQSSLIDMAAEIMGQNETSISYLYSGFSMLSFPYRKLSSDDDVWERKNGAFTLMIEPGVIPLPTGSKKFGVPYGSRARMIMLYLQTQAVKSKSRTVSLGSSMNDWMKRMGIEGRGGWNMAQIREQAMRISACRLTIAFQSQNGKNGFMRRDVVSGMINLPASRSPRQGWLLEETAELSEDFYRELIDHPLPVDEGAIGLIGNSAMTIDIYVWLAYRLRVIKGPTLIPRDALHSQFGSMYAQPRQFWVHFKKSLNEALAVYPNAKVQILKEGIKLFKSESPIPAKYVQGSRLLEIDHAPTPLFPED